MAILVLSMSLRSRPCANLVLLSLSGISLVLSVLVLVVVCYLVVVEVEHCNIGTHREVCYLGDALQVDLVWWVCST